MSALLLSAIIFVLVFGGAILGTQLHARLPQDHKEGDSRDVIKLVMGLVATIAALVLGLMIASARSSYDTQESEVRQLAVHLELVDRILSHYGPETAPARALLRQIVADDIARIWPNTGDPNLSSSTVRARAEEMFTLVAELAPTNVAQRFTQSRSLVLLTDMANTRRLMTEQAGTSLSWPFFVVLVFWLVALFVGFGLFSRFNPTVYTALFIGALSVAGAIFLILELNGPYSGVMQISSAPMRDALEQMGK